MLDNRKGGPMSTQSEIVPIARRSIHDVILKWFQDQPRGTVLDAPAGYGHLSMKLREMGYDVAPGEIEPEIFAVDDMKCIYTNLNERIEAEDDTFDYVCCVDGLEHMTNPYRAVEEFTRVLKPGGIAVFSIPNYTNIERRLKFLIFGYFTKPLSMGRIRKAGGHLYSFHNSPLTITILDIMFKFNNLDLVEIKDNQPKKKQYLLFGLVVLFWLLSCFSGPKKKAERRPDLTLDRRVILGGNNLIFILRKQPADVGISRNAAF
jgi:SAM-dependent methyltransferase